MESDSESNSLGSSIKSIGSSKLTLFKNTANKLSAIAGVAKTLKQIEEDNDDADEGPSYRYGNASPLFTPRTFKEIKDKVLNAAHNTEVEKNRKNNKGLKSSRNEIKLVLARKFNTLRLALGAIPISHSLQTTDMVTVLKLSDMLIDFGEHLDAHYLPYLRYGILLREWLIMNRSIYSRVTQTNTGSMHSMLNLKSFYSQGGDKSAYSSISTAESMRLAKGHLQLWLRQGLFADDHHLQRARELYEMSIQNKLPAHTAHRPSSAKPTLSLSSLSFNGLSSPNKRDVPAASSAAAVGEEVAAEDWLRYLRVLEFQGDHVAAAEVVSKMLTHLDPVQQQAQASEPFSAQEMKTKADRFANLLFYAGCIYKALGMFERANEYFFESIEYGPPKPLSKIEMMMIISRNLEEMQNANEMGHRQGAADPGDTNEEAYRMIHEHLILECVLDESVSYDDWVTNRNTWFALGDKCSLHHMYSMANDLYGIGIMMDPLAFQKSMVWFRFVKSCVRCGRVTDAQLAMKQALRRDEHNPQLLRADRHLSGKVGAPRPAAAALALSDGAADGDKLLADWRAGTERALFNLANSGNFAAIQSLLPAELDVSETSTRRLQAIVRGIIERFNFRMGVGLHRQQSSETAAATAGNAVTKTTRDAVRKMVAKTAVVLAIQESDVDVFEGEPEHHINYFPFLLTVRPTWMGKISHIDAYDVRGDKKLRIKLRQSFSPIQEAGVPRRLQLSMECRKVFPHDLTRENIRGSVSTLQLQANSFIGDANNNDNIFSSGKLSARTEVVLKYTDIFTGEYIYCSMQLKFSFDHKKNAIQVTSMHDSSTEMLDLTDRLSLALDDLSLSQSYQLDCNNEKMMKMRREMDTSSVVVDANSVAHFTDVSSVFSGSMASKAKEEQPNEQPAVVVLENQTHEMGHSAVSVYTPSVYESLSVTHANEDVDFSSAVILTNIQQAVIFRSSIFWRNRYYFVTIVNENDVSMVKLMEAKSLFSFVLMFQREHFDRSQKLLKCLKQLMKYLEKNALISALFTYLSEKGRVTIHSANQIVKKESERENFSKAINDGVRCYYTHYSPDSFSLLVAFYSPKNIPIIGTRPEIFDSSGHYLRGKTAIINKFKSSPRTLSSSRFRNAEIDEYLSTGLLRAGGDASSTPIENEIPQISAGNSISLQSSQQNDSTEDFAVDRAKEAVTLPVLSEKRQPSQKHHHLHYNKGSVVANSLASPIISQPLVPAALQVYHHRKDSKLHRRIPSTSTAGPRHDTPEGSVELPSDSGLISGTALGENVSFPEATLTSPSPNSAGSHSVKFDSHIDTTSTNSFDSDMRSLRLGGQIEDDSLAGSAVEVRADASSALICNMRPTFSSAIFYDLPLHVPTAAAEVEASVLSEDAPETSNSPHITTRSGASSVFDFLTQLRSEALKFIAQEIVSHILDKSMENRLNDIRQESQSVEQACDDVIDKDKCHVDEHNLQTKLEEPDTEYFLPDVIKERRKSLHQVSESTETDNQVELIVCNILEAMVLATEYLSQALNRNLMSIQPIVAITSTSIEVVEEAIVDGPYSSPKVSTTINESTLLKESLLLDNHGLIENVHDDLVNAEDKANSTAEYCEESLSPELQLSSTELTSAAAKMMEVNESIVRIMSVDYIENLFTRLTKNIDPIVKLIEHDPTPAIDAILLPKKSFDATLVMEPTEPSTISMGFSHSVETSFAFRTNLDPIAESDARSLTSLQSSLSSGISVAEQPLSSSFDEIDYKDYNSCFSSKIADLIPSIHSAVTLPPTIASSDDLSAPVKIESTLNIISKLQENNQLINSGTTPYKVTKLLSAGKKRMEAKEFFPPQNVWTPGTGTGKGYCSRVMTPSTYSFESANRLLQNLRDISHQLALKRAKMKESNDKIVAGRVGRRDECSPIRPTTAPAEGRNSPLKPDAPFRFGQDPISSFISKADNLPGRFKSKSAGINRTHSSSFDSVVNEDSDFRYRIESRPTTPERKLLSSVASPASSFYLLDSSSVEIGEAGMKSHNPSLVLVDSKAGNKSFVERMGQKYNTSAKTSFAKIRSNSPITKKQIQGSLVQSVSADSGLVASKELLLRQTIRGFSKVGYVEDKPLLLTTFWTESLTRYLLSVGSVSALRKKLMAVHRLSPVKFSLEESICALAETDGNVGEIRIKAKDLKFHSNVQLISSILPLRDLVSSVLAGGEDLFNGVTNPLKATTRVTEPPIILPILSLLPLPQNSNDSFYSAEGLSSVSNNSLHSEDEEDSFLAPLSSYEQSEITNKITTSSILDDKKHKRKTQTTLPGLAPVIVEKPRFRSMSDIYLRQESLAVRKRASVVTFDKPTPKPSISPLASLYFQKQQTKAVKLKVPDINGAMTRLLPPKDLSLSLTRSSSRHDDMSRTSESTDLYPDFDGGLQTSLDDYIDNLADAYKLEEKEWVPLVKTEFVENTFKVLSNDVIETPVQKTQIQQPPHPLQVLIHHHHHTQLPHQSQHTHHQQRSSSVANNSLLLQQQQTPIQTASKKSVRIANTITTMFEAQDSQSIAVLCRRDALRAQQEDNLMKSERFGPQPHVPNAAGRRRGTSSIDVSVIQNANLKIASGKNAKARKLNTAEIAGADS